MKVSAKAEYACLAILALARQRAGDPPVRIREISETHSIPERYLVQILLQLKAAGLVRSTRGASGGYQLARSAKDISLLEVILAIEGPAEPSRDDRNLASRVLATVLEQIRSAERAVLAETSMAHLAELSSPHDWVI